MEREFVEWLQAALPAHPLLKLGVGDDAALLSTAGADGMVVTTDLLADGTHFLAEETDAELIGRKCLAANLSDLAAMAADPLGVVVSLLLPHDGVGNLQPAALAKRLLKGMIPLAEQFDCAIAGGDTNVWSGRLAVSVTALGRVASRGPLRRDGAKVGDRLLVTGELGGSLEGHHLAFTPRVREARLLHQQYELHAGMDITDGLAIDLHRMAAASGVGALLFADQIPLSPAAERLALAAGSEAVDHALADGEDFELLLAAPPEAAAKILRDDPLECGVTEVGEIVAAGLTIQDAKGDRQELRPRGYEHG